ncbi:Uncharacterised protein [Halioglobus japonicus]|nr:Uncharacterised protein [Halioglobus japonicus]
MVVLGIVILLLLVAPSAIAAGPPKAPAHYPAIGEQVRAVPPNARSIKVNRQSYRYHNGSFYRPGPSGAYVVVQAPIGASVDALAPGYISFGIGPSRYFFANFTYYMWNEDRTAYVVVEKPQGAETAMAAQQESSSADIYVYPNKAQSTEQQGRDRYECYLWAVKQSAYDPVAGEADAARASDYQRALAACLEGRGYTVR